VDGREDTGEVDRTPSRFCLMNPKMVCMPSCIAFSKEFFLGCYVMETMRSVKVASDKVNNTADHIVQQIESGWHPK